MRAFLTGSRVYGTPHDKSDIDLVVLVSLEEASKLMSRADSTGGSGPKPDPEDMGSPEAGRSVSLRFGDLNLICVTSERWWQSWATGTEMLKAEAVSGPVSRDRAVEVFHALRLKMGLIKES